MTLLIFLLLDNNFFRIFDTCFTDFFWVCVNGRYSCTRHRAEVQLCWRYKELLV